MALKDYDEVFQVSRKKLYIVICIYNSMEKGIESPINHMLSDIMEDIKQQLEEYESVDLSYVYETEGLMEVKHRSNITKSDEAWFVMPERYKGQHNFKHMFHMGLALLNQRKQRKENVELQMYVVTDEKFKRTDNVLWEENGVFSVNPAFQNIKATFKLYKSQNAAEEKFEKFMYQNGVNNVVVY